ncbi:MAG: four helix bundle protein [Gemmatimonadetes bacterium]|nr:four helix bundle protein [Gemmatimonadota bacterium]
MRRYEDLLVYQLAEKLATDTQQFVIDMPRSLRRPVLLQLERSTGSIPDAIAEGSKKETNKEYYQYLSTGMGSVAEATTQLRRAKRAYPTSRFLAEAQKTIAHIQQLLTGLMKTVRERGENEERRFFRK